MGPAQTGLLGNFLLLARGFVDLLMVQMEQVMQLPESFDRRPTEGPESLLHHHHGNWYTSAVSSDKGGLGQPMQSLRVWCKH